MANNSHTPRTKNFARPTMDSEKLRKVLEAACESNPSNNVDGHPRLFTDVSDAAGKKELKDLWQWGLVEAQWNETEERTEWKTSPFADELEAKGLQDLYVSACRGDIPETSQPVNASVVRNLNNES